MVAGFAVIYLVWGSTFLAIKVVVGFLPPLLMAGVRASTAGAILYLWARCRGAPTPTPREWRNGLAAGALFFGGGHGALFWASQHMASGMAAVLVSTIPIWVAVFEGLARRRRSQGVRTVSGLAVGFGGMIWLNLPGTGAGLEPVASVVLLAGSACWALGTVWYRGPRRPASNVLSAGLPLLCGGLLLLMVCTALGEPSRVSPEALNPASLVALTYLVLFGSLVAFSAYSWLLGVVPATSVASYAYVNPVVALMLGWLLGGEVLASGALPPVALVLLSVILIVAGQREPGRTSPRATKPAGA